MTVDRIVLAFAGFAVFASVLLAHFVSSYWLFLTAFVGINLFQAAFTGFCPLAKVLKARGIPSGPLFK